MDKSSVKLIDKLIEKFIEIKLFVKQDSNCHYNIWNKEFLFKIGLYLSILYIF